MINKKDLKKIVKQELLPLKLSILANQKNLLNSSNFEKDYQLEHYYDTHFLMVTDIFYKLNSVLLKLKYKILSYKGILVGEKINLVLGKNNGNNIYSLFSFIEKEIGVSFDSHFVYYCVIVETLVRHQFSHGFGKSLLYMSDGHQRGLLFYHYDKWFKYKDIEGNLNSFGAIGLSYLDESDYFNCNYYNKDFSIVLNSKSARTIMQFNWIDLKLNCSVSSTHLIKQRNNFIQRNQKSIDKISIHKYTEKWVNVDNANINQLLMFPNYSCNHLNDNKCFVCHKKFQLSESKSLSEQEQKSKLNTIISINNKKRCKKIFISIIQNKLSIAFSNRDVQFNQNNIFNTYFINIMFDIFGKYIEIDYFLLFNNKKDEDILTEISSLFNHFTSDDIKQFICYKFNNDFIPLEIKIFAPFVPPSFISNINDEYFFVDTSYDLSINYRIFLKSIKKNFMSFYNRLNN